MTTETKQKQYIQVGIIAPRDRATGEFGTAVPLYVEADIGDAAAATLQLRFAAASRSAIWLKRPQGKAHGGVNENTLFYEKRNCIAGFGVR